MNEPWFDPNDLTWVMIGPILGTLAGLWGAACGVLIPRGKGKTALWVSYWFFLIAGIACAVTGAIAKLTDQPYHVWYSFALSGLVMLFLFVPFGFVLRYRWRQVEEAKMRSQDIV